MGRGRRRAGPDNDRLRAENRLLEGRLAWYRGRLRTLSAQSRTLRARAEIAEGRLAKTEQLVQRQVAQLMDRDSRIAELERLVKTSADDTVEMPIPTAAQLAAA
jgi:hypothetical protein